MCCGHPWVWRPGHHLGQVSAGWVRAGVSADHQWGWLTILITVTVSGGILRYLASSSYQWLTTTLQIQSTDSPWITSYLHTHNKRTQLTIFFNPRENLWNISNPNTNFEEILKSNQKFWWEDHSELNLDHWRSIWCCWPDSLQYCTEYTPLWTVPY